MPKTVSLITGIIVASAIVYKINEDNKLEIRQIQQKISTPTDILENKLDRENTSIHNALENSQHYFRQRLVPSVKASWNDHVTSLTHKLINSDLPTQAKNYWDKNVLGVSERKED